MAIGFVLINCTPSREHEVCDKLIKMPEIVELHSLFGAEYDLIAKVEAKEYEQIGEITIEKIRSIKDVINTKTLTGTKLI